MERLLSANGFIGDRPGVSLRREYSVTGNVTAHRPLFDRALTALLENALQALRESTRGDPQLTLRIGQDSQEFFVAVADNGVGIPAANLARLFQPGFTTRKEGRGFGLPEAAQAAAGFGGRILGASEGLHRGATFTLRWQEI